MKTGSFLILILFALSVNVFAGEPDTQDEDWLYSVDSSVVLKGNVPKVSIKPSKPFDEKNTSVSDSSDGQEDYDDIHNVVGTKRQKRGPEFSETKKGLEHDPFNDYMKADVFEPGGKIKQVDYSPKKEKPE